MLYLTITVLLRKKLPQVPETVLKRRKQRAEIRAKILQNKVKAAAVSIQLSSYLLSFCFLLFPLLDVGVQLLLLC